MDTGSEEENAHESTLLDTQVVIEEVGGARLLQLSITKELMVSQILDMVIRKLRHKGTWLRECVTWLQTPGEIPDRTRK